VQSEFIEQQSPERAIAIGSRSLVAACGAFPDLDELSSRADRHVIAYVTACAQALQTTTPGSMDERSLLDRLTRDVDLVQVALRSFFGSGSIVDSLALTATLTRFWMRTNRHHEALHLFREVEARTTEMDPRIRAAVGESAAALYRDLGDTASALREVESARALYARLGDADSSIRCQLLSRACQVDQGDWETLRAQLAVQQQAESTPHRLGDLALSLHQRGWADLQAGRLLSAGQCFTQAADLWNELGDREQQTHCLISRGSLAIRMGAVEAAQRWFEKAALQARELDHQALLAEVLADLASTAGLLGEHTVALGHLEECFGVYRRIGPRSRLPEAMEAGGSLALRCKRYAVAIRFFGAAQHLRETSGVQSFAPWSGRIAGWVAELEHVSGTAVAPVEGSSAEDLIVHATEWVKALQAGNGHGAGTLTARERDTLRLLVSGMTDQEIANALFISRRTASKHVSSVLRKLGQPTRTAAASLALRDGLI
jgi:DNA-binding CsgD family transcriptional regulator